jgi:hypothetical protein
MAQRRPQYGRNNTTVGTNFNKRNDNKHFLQLCGQSSDELLKTLLPLQSQKEILIMREAVTLCGYSLHYAGVALTFMVVDPFRLQKLTTDPHNLAHVNIECPDDGYPKLKTNISELTLASYQLHIGSIINNALHNLTLIKINIASFVGTGRLIKYFNAHKE